ncbi:MAG: hypothetical protein ACO29Y_05855 [Holophagaceae bacterium]
MSKALTNSQLAHIVRKHVSEQLDKMSAEEIREIAFWSMLEDYEENFLINDMLEGYDEDEVIKRLRSWGFN